MVRRSTPHHVVLAEATRKEGGLWQNQAFRLKCIKERNLVREGTLRLCGQIAAGLAFGRGGQRRLQQGWVKCPGMVSRDVKAQRLIS